MLSILNKNSLRIRMFTSVWNNWNFKQQHDETSTNLGLPTEHDDFGFFPKSTRSSKQYDEFPGILLVNLSNRIVWYVCNNLKFIAIYSQNCVQMQKVRDRETVFCRVRQWQCKTPFSDQNLFYMRTKLWEHITFSVKTTYTFL